jgi:glyoxylase-like metal-dependent hydrolase (beta-lactamase superfamily II)
MKVISPWAMVLALSLTLAATGARAADPVARALDKIGGAAAVESVRTLRLTGKTTFFDPEQSLHLGGEPLLGATSQFVQVRDFATDQVRTEWRVDALWPSPHSDTYVEILDASGGYVTGVDSFLPTKRARETREHRMSTMRVIATRRELERVSPRLLLEIRRHSANMKHVPGATFEGRKAAAVRFRRAGIEFTVIFDPTTGLPALIRTLDYDPIGGDQPFDIALSDWRWAGGILYPCKQVATIGHELVWTTAIEVAQVNASIGAEAFAAPSALKALPAGTPPKTIPFQWILRKQGFNVLLDSDAVGWDLDTPGLAIGELAPGVFFQSGGGYNNLIVELKDYLVVYDASHELQSESLLRTLKEKFPHKPVRYVVLTHCHFDHAGGLRSYVAAGAAVVVGKGGGDYLREALSHPATLAGVQLPAHLHPQVIEVDGRWSVSDGERSAEAYTFDNPHSDDLMLGYVPHARMGFVSDLWAPGREPVRDPLQPGLRALADGVRRWNLDPLQFAGGHGAVGPYAPVAAAAAKPSGVLAVDAIQWAAVDVTEANFHPMRDFLRDVVGMKLVLDLPDFSLFATPNGNVFELYAPDALPAPWRNGKDAMSVGFNTADIEAAAKKLAAVGVPLLEATANAETLKAAYISYANGIYTIKSPVTGRTYRWAQFRAPDGRVYSLVQR